MFREKLLKLVVAIMVLPIIGLAQVTTSSMSGFVKTADGIAIVGATVTAVHEPTGTKYITQTRTGGSYQISNMNAGGPYTVAIAYTGLVTDTRSDIYLNLGETFVVNASLTDKVTDLGNVSVNTIRKKTEFSGKGGAETTIGRDKMENLPTVGRNLQDFLRFTPQAKFSGSNGNVAGVSIAGQNNRFNSFFVDGAVNNDVFGLSASGTNGGQAGIGPISIDAIDQFQVMISPYDASIGNFTGGGINATTRSGTNRTQGSVYYFLQNQNLAGKTPTGLKEDATKFNNFKTYTAGFRIGGAIKKNKLFYFLNAELVENTRPQPFDLSQFRGTFTKTDIDNIVSTVKSRYNYETGGYLDNPERVAAQRIAAKLDWNITNNHRLALSYRYNRAERDNATASNSTTINFFNNGEFFPSSTHSGSLELKSSFRKGVTNRMLITYTNVEDDRGALGSPFPRVTINDNGNAGFRMVLGTEEFSTANYLRQKNIGFMDFLKFNLGKHYLTLGADNEFSKSYNVFIRQNYGSYTFNSINDFLNAATVRPTRYVRSFSRLDNKDEKETDAAAKFYILRLGAFINDEIKVNENLTLNLGLRADYTKYLSNPREDKFLNDTGLGKIAQYYDIKGARSGQAPEPKISLSPRFGFTYKIPEEKLTIRGGVGLFTGRVPLAWPGGIYNQNGVALGGVDLPTGTGPSLIQAPLFNPNPFAQPNATTLGVNINDLSGQVDLISKDFRLPKLLRSSLAVDKNFGNGWSGTAEAILNFNINEIDYQNINIIPPTVVLTGNGADSRRIYTTGNTPTRIPMRFNGINPYQGNIYLLSNNEGAKGFSYNFTIGAQKTTNTGFSFNANYTFGNSVSKYEGTSSQNNSQWNNLHTINGRNFAERSISDFSLGHRITAYLSKKFTYANNSLATTITLFYTGQSGDPMSYVYGGSLIRDVNNNNSRDLLYVPTDADLAAMTFVNLTVNSRVYTPNEQKAAFSDYINADSYLKGKRGQYFERNSARLPFTHNIDLSIKQDFSVKVAGHRYTFQVTYDMFNFTNFLNRDWGRSYFLGNFSSFSLLSVNSFTGNTPRYTFNPTLVGQTPYNVSTSSVPSFSARWISQLGVRFNF